MGLSNGLMKQSLIYFLPGLKIQMGKGQRLNVAYMRKSQRLPMPKCNVCGKRLRRYCSRHCTACCNLLCQIKRAGRITGGFYPSYGDIVLSEIIFNQVLKGGIEEWNK